jgi:hypothetical protein
MAQRTGRAQTHADVAVRHWADRPGVLAGHPGCVAPLVHQARGVADQHPVRIAPLLADVGAPRSAHQGSVLGGPRQHVREAVRSGGTTGFRHVPALLALCLTQQAVHSRHDPLARRRTDAIPAQPLGHVRHVGPPSRLLAVVSVLVGSVMLPICQAATNGVLWLP